MSGDRDAMVWQKIGGDPDDLQGNGSSEAVDTVEVPMHEWEQMKEAAEAVPELLDEVQDLRSRVSELEHGQDRQGPSVRDSMSTLQKYARLVEDGQEETIGAADRRAVAIYRNWDELKERLAGGSYGVSTRRNSLKKNQPSQFKIDLQNILDEDLEWEQIYRAMKAVAELSGGEPEQNEYGRTKIVGGIFEYHERTTPDSKTTYKVLIET